MFIQKSCNIFSEIPDSERINKTQIFHNKCIIYDTYVNVADISATSAHIVDHIKFKIYLLNLNVIRVLYNVSQRWHEYCKYR